MRLIKFLVKNRQFSRYPVGFDEFNHLAHLNRHVDEKCPEDTGYIGGTVDGAIGCSERIGKRRRPESGGQQDTMTMGFSREFPKEAADVPEYFQKRTAAVARHLNNKIHKELLWDAGSTLLTGVVDTRTHTVWSSNMGDGTLFLISEQEDGELKIEQLNSLDKPENTEENKRILSEGGLIEDKRLGGVLSVSAGFGDNGVKAVRRTPNITSRSYPHPLRRSWLIGACDGLTEKMGAKSIKATIAGLVAKGKEPSAMEMAHALAELATRSGSKDNISVFVSALHKLPEGSVSEYSIADGHGYKAHRISHAICEKLQEDFLKPDQSLEHDQKSENSQKIAEEQKPLTPVQKFIQCLESELRILKKGPYPRDYDELRDHVGFPDIQAIYQWLIANPQRLAGLSPENPCRFPGVRPGKTMDSFPVYPLPITIHLTMDDSGYVYLEFDPNSKEARNSLDGKITKTESKTIVPKKIRGQGSRKEVRDTWTFNGKTRRIESSVASVVVGKQDIKKVQQVHKSRALAVSGLFRTRMGAQYLGHGRKSNQPKVISFAPRAKGSLLDLIKGMDEYKPDLADILWANYSMIKEMVKFHQAGFVHRDLKPRNFLFFCPDSNKKVMEFPVIDLDDSIPIENSEKNQDRFIGTAHYLPYDHPYLEPIINAHGEVLKKMKRFDNGNFKTSESKEYKAYYSLISDDKADKDPVLKYIKEQLGHFTKLPRFKELADAVGIIAQQKKPITIGKRISQKNDVAALSITLKQLIESYISFLSKTQTQTPQILLDLKKIMEENIKAPQASRMSMAELLAKVEYTLNIVFAGPVAGVSEKERSACMTKLKARTGQSNPLTQLDERLKSELITYRNSRAQHDEYLDCFGRFFGRSLGYSKTDKTTAVNKLLAINNGSPFVKTLSDQDMGALFSGTLKNITNPHKALIKALIGASNDREDVVNAIL